MEAAKMGEDKDLQYLLKSGADVNTRDKHGCTPLVYADRYGHIKCIDLLLQAGADVAVLWDFYPKTPLMLALSWNGGNLVLTETKGKVVSSALHCAFQGECDKVIKFMIQAGVDVNIREQFFHETTVLIESAKRGWYQCVNATLKAGANVNVTDTVGKNALMYACISDNMHVNNKNINSSKCVQLLLTAGAHVNRTDKLGFTALSTLLYHHHFKGGIKHYKNLLKLLAAAGEILNWNPQEFVRDFVTNDMCLPRLSLMHMSRETIGRHLMQMSHINLFITIPRLGLPSSIQSYLLYDMSLDVEYEYM